MMRWHWPGTWRRPQRPTRNVHSEVAIDDAPRFAWRGMMIDCSRHFLPVPLIKRMVDALSAAKGNVLHWHFMDGQR